MHMCLRKYFYFRKPSYMQITLWKWFSCSFHFEFWSKAPLWYWQFGKKPQNERRTEVKPYCCHQLTMWLWKLTSPLEFPRPHLGIGIMKIYLAMLLWKLKWVTVKHLTCIKSISFNFKNCMQWQPLCEDGVSWRKWQLPDDHWALAPLPVRGRGLGSFYRSSV